MITHIVNEKAIILFFDGSPKRVEKTDARYPRILASFKLPASKQEDEIKRILEPESFSVSKIAKEGGDKFLVKGDDVYYGGELLPESLRKKVISIVREGLPLENFEKFWKNLSNNPSATSVEELMDFLNYKELPITEDGCFLAYRGVSNDYWSIHGNTSTKVLKGQVNSAGQIYNGIGEEIEVLRRDVDDKRERGCSSGLHIGSLDYAKGWGNRVIVVKVNPADVVSVPEDCSCQKCRVSKYKVMYDYVEEIVAPVVDEEGVEKVKTNHAKTRSEFIDRISNYLDKKVDDGYDSVTIRQIQNIFTKGQPRPSREEVIDALQSLFFIWDDDGNVWLD